MVLRIDWTRGRWYIIARGNERRTIFRDERKISGLACVPSPEFVRAVEPPKGGTTNRGGL